MQSYRIYFTVAGGNMRPLFIGGLVVIRILMEGKMTFQTNAFGKDLLWFAFKWGITIYAIVWLVILSCGIGKKKD